MLARKKRDILISFLARLKVLERLDDFLIGCSQSLGARWVGTENSDFRRDEREFKSGMS